MCLPFKNSKIQLYHINSQLSRSNKAGGSITDLVTVGPTKVNAGKSLAFSSFPSQLIEKEAKVQKS